MRRMRGSVLLVLVVVLFAGGMDPVAAAPAAPPVAPVGDASKVAPLTSPAPAVAKSQASSGDFSFAPPLAGGKMPVVEGPGKGFSEEESRKGCGG